VKLLLEFVRFAPLSHIKVKELDIPALQKKFGVKWPKRNKGLSC
jgi:hypothetical protein